MFLYSQGRPLPYYHLFPEDNMNRDYFERYSRQLFLPSFGKAAQDKLQSAHVLIIGMGGLGCPVAQYLTAAGIGKITIVDDDVVQLSNLHRQVLYAESDIGKNKVDVAKEKLSDLNKNVLIDNLCIRWNKEQCFQYIPQVDLVVDCSDNFGTRYLLDDACRLLKKPLVFGAVSKFEGQVAVFLPDNNCYRNIFPEPPASGLIRGCSEEGVLGMLPGIIGNIQAMEVVKYVTGFGAVLVNKLLTYDALNQQMYTVDVVPVEHSGPVSVEEFALKEYNIPKCTVS